MLSRNVNISSKYFHVCLHIYMERLSTLLSFTPCEHVNKCVTHQLNMSVTLIINLA